eukprot:scaffold994_cov165-Ochromonas_danica.AAC.3
MAGDRLMLSCCENASHTPLSTLTGLWSSSSTNSLYLAEFNKHRVHKVDLSTQHMSVYAGTGVGGYSVDGVSASISQLNLPISLCGDSVGNLYIAEYGSHRWQLGQSVFSCAAFSTLTLRCTPCIQAESEQIDIGTMIITPAVTTACKSNPPRC